MKNFIPMAARQVLAKPYTLQAGDTPWSIAQAFGQGWAGYKELVGANLHRELLTDAMPPGHPATFGNLREGQLMHLPASWAPAVRRAGGIAVLRDMLDLLRGFMQGVLLRKLEQEQKKGIPPKFNEGMNERIVNAATQWYRQANPNTPVTDVLALPFINSAIEWAQLFGIKIPMAHADGLPWTEVPWLGVPFERVPWTAINWAAVSQWVNANVQPGQVQNQIFQNDWSKANWKGTTFFQNDWSKANWKGTTWPKIPWGSIPWVLVPWSLIPWQKLTQANKWVAILAAISPDPQSATVAFINAMRDVLPPPVDDAGPPVDDCAPPRFKTPEGKCLCPPGTVWNLDTKKCQPKGTHPPGPDAPCPEGAGFHRDTHGNCVPNVTDQPPPPEPKKEGFPWGTLLLLTAAAFAGAVATGAAKNFMEPDKKKATRARR